MTQVTTIDTLCRCRWAEPRRQQAGADVRLLVDTDRLSCETARANPP